MAGFKIDVTQVEQLTALLKQVPARMRSSFGLIKPEMGAYMIYSAVLEFGHTFRHEATLDTDTRKKAADDRRRRRGITLKGVAIVQRFDTYTTTTMPARPHIVPAIKNNIPFIIESLRDNLEVELGGTIKHKRATSFTKENARRVWLRTLMNKPLREAQQNSPIEFGMHRRSIRVFDQQRSNAVISVEQAKAKARASRKNRTGSVQ